MAHTKVYSLVKTHAWKHHSPVTILCLNIRTQSALGDLTRYFHIFNCSVFPPPSPVVQDKKGILAETTVLHS